VCCTLNVLDNAASRHGIPSLKIKKVANEGEAQPHGRT